ncbi:hypothetical protein [Hyphomicrobium sp.]|uniref:hypothetical protein n=1 Tax=Hyphomicrobium sp. TaxID=82 RepID=UPI0025C52DE0|nr:hypothetical protein [Hyphomicrobium sp.]MCC7252428.1 hypothetical protein [Hyphomicrobium sp.]
MIRRFIFFPIAQAQTFVAAVGVASNILAGIATQPAPAQAEDKCVVARQGGPCKFSRDNRAFEGTPAQQARCLLRELKVGGTVGRPMTQLPAPLDKLIGTPTTVRPAEVAAYAERCRIPAAELGSAYKTEARAADAPAARYFVLHDTALALFRGKTPTSFDMDTINSAVWPYNARPKWSYFEDKISFMVNRAGSSTPFVPLNDARPKDAMRLEVCFPEVKPLFIHVEHVMPRSTPAKKPNDSYFPVTPTPAYTDAQMQRSALLYIVSSVWAGRWLIPAFHAHIDGALRRDDPQGFNVAAWSAAVARAVDDISKGTSVSCPKT